MSWGLGSGLLIRGTCRMGLRVVCVYIYIYTCVTFKGFAGLHGNVYLFIEMLTLFGHIWGCERLSGVTWG